MGKSRRALCACPGCVLRSSRENCRPKNAVEKAHYVMRNLTNEFDFSPFPSSMLSESERRYSPDVFRGARRPHCADQVLLLSVVDNSDLSP